MGCVQDVHLNVGFKRKKYVSHLCLFDVAEVVRLFSENKTGETERFIARRFPLIQTAIICAKNRMKMCNGKRTPKENKKRYQDQEHE